MKYDRWAATVARFLALSSGLGPGFHSSCCDCPQNGTINVAHPFSQIAPRPGQQLLNTVNKCQCCQVPLPRFIDNIMTFSYHFSNCKKKGKFDFFCLKPKLKLFCQFGGWTGLRVCPFTAGYRQTYWTFNYDFLLVFPLQRLSVGQTIVK